MESLLSRLAETLQLRSWERMRTSQNKFTNSFYRLKYNMVVLGAGCQFTQRN